MGREEGARKRRAEKREQSKKKKVQGKMGW